MTHIPNEAPLLARYTRAEIVQMCAAFVGAIFLWTMLGPLTPYRDVFWLCTFGILSLLGYAGFLIVRVFEPTRMRIQDAIWVAKFQRPWDSDDVREFIDWGMDKTLEKEGHAIYDYVWDSLLDAGETICLQEPFKVLPDVTEPGYQYKLFDFFDARRDYRHRYSTLVGTTTYALAQLALKIPDLPPPDEDTSAIPLQTPLPDAIPNFPRALERLIRTFFTEGLIDGDMAGSLRERLLENLAMASRTTIDRLQIPKATWPTSYKGSPTEMVDVYLKGTPLRDIFTHTLPIPIPQAIRFEGQWILAPQGRGKTQLIQYQIAKDISAVLHDEATVVVIDSQNELIPNIAHLDVFREQPERLLVVDPRSPISINPFNTPHAQALDLLSFIFADLLGVEMTSKQRTPWRYLIRALSGHEGATIDTLRKALRDPSVLKGLDNIPPRVREFIKKDYGTSTFRSTREELGWRLDALLENDTVADIMSHPTTSFDMFEEMRAPKVICIDTNAGTLGKEGCAFLGRFFIALILQATQHRSSLKASERKPVYVYIDEAHDYISNDRNVTTLLDQARKQRVGLIIAHQRCNQMSAPVLDALQNVGIKCVNSVGDARTVARHLQTTPEFIEQLKVLQFAVHVRDATRTAMTFDVPAGVMEQMPRMSEAELRALRTEMAARYAPKEEEPQEEPPKKPEPQKTNGEPPIELSDDL